MILQKLKILLTKCLLNNLLGNEIILDFQNILQRDAKALVRSKISCQSPTLHPAYRYPQVRCKIWVAATVASPEVPLPPMRVFSTILLLFLIPD